MTSDTPSTPRDDGRPLRIGLFVTCLVDLMRPNVGFASVKLLEDAGCLVEVPELQTCCGQPAYNSGDFSDTQRIAEQVIAAFEQFDYLVAPSGSCLGMIKEHYPKLFATDAGWRNRAQQLAGRSYELLSFLHGVLGVENIDAEYAGVATYHDSCSGLRELSIHGQPRALLGNVSGLELREMTDSNVCCGFGGTFCVKYPKISEHLVSNKVANIADSGADTLLGGDLGCLLNIAGRIKREGRDTKVFHTAEVLAGMTDVPAIGDADTTDKSP
ncbi:MAG: (Fe-S)-binding protein [Gammaproteobacteria bacterium]|nr:(Fe-S)-binding protein [Gammaproteobacteria bacterium]MDX2461622.1 (Fe-S)-binding protein [Gammaproteobacteria bacterium]